MLSVARVKVSKKNQIAVPAAVRKQLGIKPGDWIEVEVIDDHAVLRPRRRSALEELLSIAPEMWRGRNGEAYLRELRDEWSHREL
jgi:AbrB family looped-hinge helix DNA binding protein